MVDARIVALFMLFLTAAACSPDNSNSGDSPATADVAPPHAASPMPGTRLEQENSNPIHNPTWRQVESALRAINPETKSFFILSGENGYVQCAGSASRLTVEHRTYTADSFSHYRLGRAPLIEKTVTLRYSGGDLRVRESEVLTIEDCLSIFQSYFESRTVPASFHLRLLDETYE